MNVATPATKVIVDDPLRLPEKMNTRCRICLGGYSIECCRLLNQIRCFLRKDSAP